MPYRFLHDVAGLKMIGAGVVAFMSLLGDAASEAMGGPWESLGLKTALVVAIIYLVRENARQRDVHQAEAKEREARLMEVMKANTEAKEEQTKVLMDLKASSETQTGYFKTVAQTLLNREVKPKLPD